MKVNMTPNPLDVVTIHASQGDTEARQWEFELHNNGELIDTSEITEQMVIKSYKGGTEQILPENTSTPTTSPFKGDIRYPQGLLTDQEFLYRESPTEEDGLAKITDIKGNTLVWNQQNYDNFTDTSKWLVNDGSKYSVSVSGNVLTVTCTGAPDNNASVRISGVNSIVGHKYLLLSDVKSPKAVGFRYLYSPVASGSLSMSVPANVWTQFGKVVQINSSSGFYVYFNSNNALAQGDAVEIKNHQIIDLTQMFGTTKADEIYAMEQAQSGSGIAYFKTYYPLPYYAYNQGTLLSFNGNGIKTVGFNQWDEEWEVGNWRSFDGQSGSLTDRIRSKNYIEVFPNKDYYFKSPVGFFAVICWYDENHAFINSTGGTSSSVNTVFKSPLNAKYMRFCMNDVYGTVYNNNICINISSSRNGEYEPYASSTLSLPISTYFSNGMKSAGNVYDELTPTKGITRIGAVDLGSLGWVANPNVSGGFNCRISDMKLGVSGEMSSLICPLYETINTKYYGAMNTMQNMQIAQSNATQGELYLINTSYSDATAFKTAMSGVYLYYELVSPTETSFTTASLVTENAEIPLSNEDGVLVGKCTEQLSSESGFFDAKIKLADEDGECYSNKIQLHVERSPQ